MRLLDSAVTGALILLVGFTALAFGSVYPWAFKAMEVSTFALAAIWMASLLVCSARGAGVSGGGVYAYCIPVLLFVGFCAVQLLPLPPAVLAALSPKSFSLYENVLPGWPRRAPYGDVAFVDSYSNEKPLTPEVVVLPTPDEVQRGAAVPFEPAGTPTVSISANVPDQSKTSRDTAWRTERERLPRYGISMSPSLGQTALLKACSYAALFLLVLGCARSESKRAHRFVRTMAIAVLAIGLLIAALGLVNRALWNGKVLWILTPRDWGAGGLIDMRASGPFVNPDDFANYLALILPLALAGALYNVPLKYDRRLTGFRILGATAAFVIASAILLSLSRAGWIAAAVGVFTFFLLVSGPWPTRRNAGERGPESGQHRSGVSRVLRPLLLGGGMLVVLILFAVVVVGPMMAGGITARVDTTSHDASVAARFMIWRDSFGMIRDFPIFGVGLGGWPVIFPRYQSGPWFPLVYRQAHNDYVQLIAETGLLGLALVVWILVPVCKRLSAARRDLAPENWPLFAALVSALPAMAVHEFFDFCFHIPANAILFTLLVALAVRASSQHETPEAGDRSSRALVIVASICGVAGAIVLIFAAVSDRPVDFPYDLSTPHSATQALSNVLDHPVRSDAHLWLVGFFSDSAGLTPRLQEYRSAVYLDPLNPNTRDAYVVELFAANKPAEALAQISAAVFNAPNQQFYVRDRYVPFLTPAVTSAIEEGYQKALAHHYPGALEGLAGFYAAQGRYDEEAQMLAEYVQHMSGPKPSLNLLMSTARAYLKAGNRSQAEAFFRETMSEYSYDSAPYLALITEIYGPEGNLAAAGATVEQGIDNGLDPTPLYFAVLGLAQAAGDKALIESTLRELLARRPSPGLVIRLGSFYLDNNQLAQAIPMFRRATDMDPDSADAYFLLGRAEEADYHYSAADDAYGRAIALAPDNAGYKQAYQAFRDKMRRDSANQ
ncbi:MAG: O-antigen ligase family protein [Candidatus Binataceae bacterium]